MHLPHNNTFTVHYKDLPPYWQYNTVTILNWTVVPYH